MAKPKVIAVANQKGGVGKNISVYCIGARLAEVSMMDKPSFLHEPRG